MVLAIKGIDSALRHLIWPFHPRFCHGRCPQLRITPAAASDPHRFRLDSLLCRHPGVASRRNLLHSGGLGAPSPSVQPRMGGDQSRLELLCTAIRGCHCRSVLAWVSASARGAAHFWHSRHHGVGGVALRNSQLSVERRTDSFTPRGGFLRARRKSRHAGRGRRRCAGAC